MQWKCFVLICWGSWGKCWVFQQKTLFNSAKVILRSWWVKLWNCKFTSAIFLSKWLYQNFTVCGNSCSWAHGFQVHIVGTNESKSAHQVKWYVGLNDKKICLELTTWLTYIYIYIYIYNVCFEHSGDMSCSLLFSINPSHTDESWAGRNTCMWIYIYIYIYQF